MKVGDKIRYLREKRGWSQGELARVTGITQTNISRYELNKMIPHGANLLKLAETLRITIDWLLSEKEEVEYKDMLNDPMVQKLLESYKDFPESVKEEMVRYFTYTRDKLKKKEE